MDVSTINKYSHADYIALLKHKIAIEAEFAKELSGQDKVDREHFMGGMKYALDLLQNPDHNGMDEVRGDVKDVVNKTGIWIVLRQMIQDKWHFEEMEEGVFRRDDIDIKVEVIKHNESIL